jgi:hypothetical protein
VRATDATVTRRVPYRGAGFGYLVRRLIEATVSGRCLRAVAPAQTSSGFGASGVTDLHYSVLTGRPLVRPSSHHVTLEIAAAGRGSRGQMGHAITLAAVTAVS